MPTHEALKWVHVLAVAVSGLLFAFRGFGVAIGRQEPMMSAGFRYSSYAIDTVLLSAGIGLAVALGPNPLGTDWLGLKLLLLVVYIVLGSFALKRGRTAPGRRIAYVAALGVYGWMVGIALQHHPLGWLARLTG